MADVLSPADLDRLAERLAEAVTDRLARQPLLVDRVELASMLRVSVPTVERRMRDGSIPRVLLGRRVLFHPQTVVEALSRNEKGGPSQ